MESSSSGGGDTRKTEKASERPFAGGASYFGMRAIQYGVLFVSALLVARALGPAGRARYALPLALAGTTYTVLHLTLEGAGGRLIGRQEASLEEVARFLALAWILISFVGAGIVLAAGLLGRHAFLAGADTTTVVVAALAVGAQGIQSISGYLLFLVGDLRSYGIAVLVSAVFQLGATIVLIAVGGLTPAVATAVTVAGFAGSGCLMSAALGRRLGYRSLIPSTSKPLAMRLLRAGISLHPLSIAIELGPRIDLLVVGALVSAREAGVYSLSLTLADAALLASWTLAQTALRPLTEKDAEDAARFNLDFMRQSLIIATIAAVISSVAAYPFIRIVYGPTWLGAVAPLVVLILAVLATSLEGPARLLLTRIGRPARLSILACSGVVLNVVLTVVLIGPLGILGAAIASLAAYWMYATAVLWMVREETGQRTLPALRRLPSRDDYVVGVMFRAGRLVSGRLRTRG